MDKKCDRYYSDNKQSTKNCGLCENPYLLWLYFHYAYICNFSVCSRICTSGSSNTVAGILNNTVSGALLVSEQYL